VTDGEIAQGLGDPAASREVGAALGRNPVPLLVPCHRVVAAGGRLRGFSAAGGSITKRRLLEIERARPDTGPDLIG
jgi:methylated-DNA-[protein]-cysteine S-methyltransferase